MATKIKHFKAIVGKTNQRNPFTLTIDERVDSKKRKRYTKEYSACRAAVRHFRDRLLESGTHYNKGVHITLPGGRTRMGYVWSDGSVHLNAIETPSAKSKKK